MTTQLITILTSGLFAAAVLICILAVLFAPRSLTTAERLVQVGAPEPPDPEGKRSLEQLELSRPFTERIIVPALQWLNGKVVQRLPGNNPEGVSIRLARAGTAHGLTVEVFLGLKVVAALAFAAVALPMQLYVLSPSTPIMMALWTAVCAVAGFFLPDLWLRDRMKRRQKAIGKGLPDTVDLISVSVEAGLGFDAALLRITQKTQNPLMDEFEQYLREMQLGKPRREALRQIQVRTGLDDLHSFISAVIQADQLGVSMAKMLRVQSEHLRVKRRQRAEQLAQKAPLKMLFPMILFIFPSIFVVILGPAIQQLMHI